MLIIAAPRCIWTGRASSDPRAPVLRARRLRLQEATTKAGTDFDQPCATEQIRIRRRNTEEDLALDEGEQRRRYVVQPAWTNLEGRTDDDTDDGATTEQPPRHRDPLHGRPVSRNGERTCTDASRCHADIGLGNKVRCGVRRIVASYELNEVAVAKCRALIDAHQYVLDSDWQAAQPSAEQQNAYLERHGWDDYSAWHLGLTVGAERREARRRYPVRVRRPAPCVHRTGRPRCVYLSGVGVAPQGDRARGPRPLAAPRHRGQPRRSARSACDVHPASVREAPSWRCYRRSFGHTATVVSFPPLP